LYSPKKERVYLARRDIDITYLVNTAGELAKDITKKNLTELEKRDRKLELELLVVQYARQYYRNNGHHDPTYTFLTEIGAYIASRFPRADNNLVTILRNLMITPVIHGWQRYREELAKLNQVYYGIKLPAYTQKPASTTT